MRTLEFGPDGPRVSALALGCMAMSEHYGPADAVECKAVLDRARQHGITLFDTSDAYGRGANEELVAEVLGPHRERLLLSTKGGIVFGEDGAFAGIDGSPSHLRAACEASLRRLGTDRIDFYFLHRVDPGTPIEDSMEALAELREQGKIRWIGLSEVGTRTLERARRVAPVSVVQSEYSLLSREVEDEVLPWCREHGAGFMAYSPLGRGLLAGAFRDLSDLALDDWRRRWPRLEEEALAANLALVDDLAAKARELSCTPAQLALAWLLRRPGVVPVFGARTRYRLDEDVESVALTLTDRDLTDLEVIAPRGRARGGRYDARGMRWIQP